MPKKIQIEQIPQSRPKHFSSVARICDALRGTFKENGVGLKMAKRVTELVHGKVIYWEPDEEKPLKAFLTNFAQKHHDATAEMLLKRIEVDSSPPEEMIEMIVSATLKKNIALGAAARQNALTNAADSEIKIPATPKSVRDPIVANSVAKGIAETVINLRKTLKKPTNPDQTST